MNRTAKRLPKLDIVVYRVDFESETTTRQAFDLIRMTDRSFNYPFGYGKLQFHGPLPHETDEKKSFVYATVHMFLDKYLRKCAYSDSDQIRKVCLEWVKANAPEQLDYFRGVCQQAFAIKQAAIERNAARKIMEK